MKTLQVIARLLLGLLLLHCALGDLPVHCEFSQIRGKWTLRTTANTFTKEVVNSCELRKPIVSQGEITIELEFPNIIKNATHQIGTWVLIYDQGFELIFHGQKFFAFFNYTEQGDTVISDCDHTLTGWYHEDRPKATAWGCFRGYKHRNATAEYVTAATTDRVSVDSLAAISLYKFGKAYKSDLKRIEALNKVQKSWKAKAMKQWEGIPLKEFYKKLGIKHSLNSAKRIAAHRRHKEMMKKHNSKKMLAQDFPKAFDWRNVSGENYVTKVRDQMLCGSCYAMAAMAMYESRIRILSRLKEQPIYSPQDIVSCSQYSQQCDGGFPYLIGKYGQDFGFVEEKCNTYKGVEFVCEDNCPPEARIYVKEYGYVGGYYGASNEENMLQALLTYGPLVVGIEVDQQFYDYESGIFHYVNQTLLMQAGDVPPPPPHFEVVNHAVLLVGYGEENGEKYWIIRNSWGEEWGEAGYARIRRSTDEIGIESDVTFGDLLIE